MCPVMAVVTCGMRSNGGGALPEAIRMAGLCIREGPVVQVRERRGVYVINNDNPAVAWRKPPNSGLRMTAHSSSSNSPKATPAQRAWA